MAEIVGWSTTSNFTDVLQLPKLQFGTVVVEFQGHHVIPRSVFGGSDFLAALKQDGFFDPNTFKANGVVLRAKGSDPAKEGADMMESFLGWWISLRSTHPRFAHSSLISTFLEER